MWASLKKRGTCDHVIGHAVPPTLGAHIGTRGGRPGLPSAGTAGCPDHPPCRGAGRWPYSSSGLPASLWKAAYAYLSLLGVIALLGVLALPPFLRAFTG